MFLVLFLLCSSCFTVFAIRDGSDYCASSLSEAAEVTTIQSSVTEDLELLDGNQVLHVKRNSDVSFGDLVLKDNATLIIDNFKVIPHTLKATDNSRIILINGATLGVARLSSCGFYYIQLMDEAQLNATESLVGSVWCQDNSKLSIDRSTFEINSFSLYASGNSSIKLNNCNININAIKGNANLTITNSRCSIYAMSEGGQVYASNSSIGISEDGMKNASKLLAVDSTFWCSASLLDESNVWLINCTADGSYLSLYDDSNFWVVNSTWNRLFRLSMNNQSNLWFINSIMTENEAMEIFFEGDQAKIRFCWYLSALVKSVDGVALENFNVGVYLTNGSLIDEGITDENGNVQFILERHVWNNEKSEYFVPHIVKASGAYSQQETTVELDSNKEIALTVDTTIPDVWSLSGSNLILIVIAIVAAALILVYLKKRK